MPFDPTLPADGSLIASAELRNQFNALNDALAAVIAAGGVTGAVVDSVTTESPGAPASAFVAMDGGTLRFTFVIPQGFPGEVSQAQLSSEVQSGVDNAVAQSLSQSSNQSNAVATLDSAFADPDMDAMRQKLNELIMALRR